MIIAITRNKVTDRAAYMPLAMAFAEDIKTIPGCNNIRMVLPEDSEDEVMFISNWDSKEAWQAHVGGDVFNKHIPGMGPYYVSGVDTFYEVVM